jgi:glycosyltransferase involved in cell wall biosynthesis
VLPYVDIIQNNRQPKPVFYLVTFEQEFYSLKPEDQKKEKERLKSKGVHWVPFQYTKLGWRAVLKQFYALLYLLFLIVLTKINFIHVFCSPPGVMGFILSKITGKPLIIDSYEPHAESMVENGTWTKEGKSYKFLFRMEKLMSARAKYVIAAATKMKDYSKEKYAVEFNNHNYFVKPACVNLELFSSTKIKNQDLLKELGLKDKIVCVYAGKFGGIYLGQETFDFFKACHNYWGDKFRALLLTSNSKEEIIQYCKNSDLDYQTIIQTFVPFHQIPMYIGLGDFAITPVKPVPSKRYCTPIKDGEYWAMGLPVVIPSDISDDSDIIKENKIGAIIESFDEKGYLKAVKEIDSILTSNSKQEIYHRIRTIAEKYRSYEVARKIYSTIYS